MSEARTDADRLRYARPALAAWLAALELALVPAAAAGEPADPPFGRGRVGVGIEAGYSVPYQFYDDDSDVEDSNFVAVLPQLSVGVTDPLGSDAWYRGNFDLVGEISALIQVDPRSGWALGGTLLGRYNLLSWGRFVPFVEVGAGIVDLQFDLDRRSDGFNFTPQGGIGFHWLLGQRAALTAGWRYHHISNAGIHNPNVAVDSNLFLIGMTWFPH